MIQSILRKFASALKACTEISLEIRRNPFDFSELISVTLRRNQKAIAELDIMIMSLSKEGVSWTLLLVLLLLLLLLLDRGRSPGFAAAAAAR